MSMKDEIKTKSPLMKNDAQRNGAAEAPKKMPTLEDCEKWVRQDLGASIYFLQVLRENPEVLKACAKKMLEWAGKQNGAGIDHVEASEEAKGYAD